MSPCSRLRSKNISEVYTTLACKNNTGGLPVLYNIFASNPSLPNYFSFLLSRSNLGVTDGGIFSVGEVDPNWSAVLNQTQIPVVSQLEQWISVMDGVVVDGKNFSGHGLLSKVKGVSDSVKNKTLSLLDSGTSLGIMPQYYWDAVYKDVPGIKALDAKNGVWQLPCDTRKNVSMIFKCVLLPPSVLSVLTR